jgi:hypothetical protein
MLTIKNVGFNRGRFRTYYGNIGELIVEESLAKEGFEVWQFRPYSIDEQADIRFALAPLYRRQYGELKETERTRLLQAFFEGNLQNFERYVEETNIMTYDAEQLGSKRHRKYKPDMLAKKDGKVYVVEVKTNSGKQNLKGEKLEGLLLAKKFGFAPMVVTLNIEIQASDLVAQEL